MAGEQTVSGHITWKQQAGSVLQQRKIFRSSPTTRRSHFIWPGGCGHRIDTFPTVRAAYAVVHLSAAPSHIFFPLHVLFISPLTNLTSIFFNSFSHFFSPPLPPSPPASSTSLASSPARFVCLPSSATLPHHVSVARFSPLPPSPSNALIPASVTLFLSLFVVGHT